jgi:hypothetical protein
LRGLSVAGTAAAGTLLGHWFAYVVAVPHAAARAETLVATGHGYWALAVKLAAVLILAGIGGLAVRHLGDAPGRNSPRVLKFSWTATRLAAVQTVLFIGMEAFERIGAGVPLGSMFAHHLFFLGVATQLVVAFAAALILVVLDRGARALVAALRGPHPGTRPARHRWAPQLVSTRRPAVLAGAAGLRGPPSL